MRTRIFLLLVWAAGCTSSSFDLSGPLGDECDGAACRPVSLDEGMLADARPDAVVPPVDLGVDAAPDRGVEVPDAAPDQGPVDAAVDAADLCAPETTRPCGPAQGTCTPGTETCGPNGQWGPCEGATGPDVEACDGLDNDCDGATDEAVTLPCGPDEGACEPGVRRCEGGVLGACEGAVGPSPEACNGADDDCDGATDEEVLQACEPAAGVCAVGTQACLEGNFGACEQPNGPVDEVCDGGDNDCDGAIDEEIVRLCGLEEGACEPGLIVCRGGLWSLCEGGVGPTDEVCNNIDDDCDGLVDEALLQACGRNVAPCEPGTQVCVAGEWGACEGGIEPAEEICDGADNDCDGSADEALAEVACGAVGGRCQLGVRRCVDGMPSECIGGIEPLPEDCNGEDDDCDGLTDEALERVCGANVGICLEGIERCEGGVWGECLGGIPPLFETCNGLDDDCDGQIDRSADGQPAACQVAHGTADCVDGGCQLVACDGGFSDANGDPGDGCERGVAPVLPLQLIDPVLAGTPVRVRVGQGVVATAFLRGADPAMARLTLQIGEAAREIGDVSVAYQDIDLATSDPGFVVVGAGERSLMRTPVVTWTRRAGDGTLLFSGFELAPNIRRVTVAAAPVGDSFLVAWVDGDGQLFYMVRRLSGRGDPIAGPFRLTASSEPDVRPAAVALEDGYAVLAPVAVAGGGQLGMWLLGFDGEPFQELATDLPAAATGISVTTTRGLGRAAVSLANDLWIQDFTPFANRGRFGPGRALGLRLTARDPGLIAAPNGWIAGWLDLTTLRPMAALLDAEGGLLGDPFPLLPGLRDPVDLLHFHAIPNAAQGRIGVTTGPRGRTAALQFN